MAPHAEELVASSPASKSRFHASSTSSAIQLESERIADIYAPIPTVFARAEGAHVWDPEGRQYLDFLSAYSVVNQGHCHPALVKTLAEQASRLTICSRAFYSDVLPKWAEKVTDTFGYEKVLPMCTGAEAVETAVKIARKWAYKTKKVQKDEAWVFGAQGNFHGRSTIPITLSTDPNSSDNYGPLLPNVTSYNPDTGMPIRYSNIADLEAVLEKYGSKAAAFICEPIQGEAGIIVPDEDYLSQVAALCKRHNVLFICDEIQAGIGRTGRMLCSEWADIKPDMVTLGKALSGGLYPMSCVLTSTEIMSVMEPGTHGSTYGGNPLGCAVSIRALEVMEEEDLVNKAERLGRIFREGLAAINSPILKTIRGKGLLNAVVIDEEAAGGRTARDLCILLGRKGLLTKPTQRVIIRFAPPLVISEVDLRKGIAIIAEALKELPTMETDS
ncbi:pyridoxal phosphate-dependent transferase [Fusarium flagelliforme]|uniref:Ornithine aminotransferase n=1 Tax=Fusarium flagelliforme TaxID=2675880 RepID=A0A395N3F9_9HYPO|nr:pyridoxal phosphate-dependent transferase [Fusarium flagelliforme]KAH7182568.1 pyridoxal phosphate-dependent transferase [Fusarium flagelliforme]RFN54674.1 ornithine aminotransferase [Fusarium flagelliforme]